MKLKKIHWVAIIAALLIIAIDLLFLLDKPNVLVFILGIAFAIGFIPFVVDISVESKRVQKVNEMFLEFARNLAESVSTGTPVSRAIVNMKNKDFGVLTPYVTKLANQVELGVPVSTALHNFAEEIDSPVVKRAVALIREAERAGGEIDYILDSTARAISEVEKLKNERRSSVYNLAVQGYIIFFIFIGIVLVMKFKVVPLAAGLQGFGSLTNPTSLQNVQSASDVMSGNFGADQFTQAFLYLLLAQGFFMGLVIGKLTEDSMLAGIKHSFILMLVAFLVSTGADLFATPSSEGASASAAGLIYPIARLLMPF
ncbi:type II secretion system F family protein [Candidatus Pacearchaeota archaeon]|nr:MAG: type II secretion system F family protein [Candidatus Pacearchaeota archaeon]